jgi:hydroxyacylglutathione hydrolase
MFEQFSDEGLAQRSYLIACGRTREAAVVDPRRDIDVYMTAARKHGLELTLAIETHIHADFVSGARELAAVGARVVSGPGADLQYPFHEAHDGEGVRVGDITLDVLHTPGHTPEHISLLVREPGQPVRVLTGDTLFVGAVGRPDLLGEDQARGLAEQLYDSLFDRLLTLDDAVEVHPGHGAGSLCGAGIGHAPHSTIGQERRSNHLLQQRSKATFVAAVLNDLPDTPGYFARMKQINRQGPPLLSLANGVPALASVAATDAVTMAHDGAIVLDLRSSEAFGVSHPTGAVNIGYGSRVGYWAGWVIAPNVPLLLLSGAAGQADEAYRQLLRVGLDNVAGPIDGGFDAWRATGGPVTSLPQISARTLRDRLGREPLTVVDVRSPREWRDGHVEPSVNVPVGDLAGAPAQATLRDLRRAGPVATICEGGYRSSLAASLLQRAGVEVMNVTDGTSAYRVLARLLE